MSRAGRAHAVFVPDIPMLGAFGAQSADMGIDDIYSKAKRAKPEFDAAVERVAKQYGAEAITTPLKDKMRAQEKANALYDGDLNRVEDILRASIIAASNDKVASVFNDAIKEFDVVKAVNKYGEKQHSSDGYFDARLLININGLLAEVQIHTQAMQAAKENVHDLYAERQRITRSAKSITPEQRKRIAEINKQMRDIFRKASS